MLRAFPKTALLTGTFRAVFAVAVDLATEMLERGQVVVLSCITGFPGNLFAQTLRRYWKGD